MRVGVAADHGRFEMKQEFECHRPLMKSGFHANYGK